MINIKSKVADIVVDDYRSASVFRKYGIDFCCGGGKPLDRVCKEKNIDISQLLVELDAFIAGRSDNVESYGKWTLTRLVEHIVNRHHRYVREAIDELRQYLNKLAQVHGHSDPELLVILQEFQQMAGELTAHMQKEELILFPYIQKLERSFRQHSSIPRPHFKTISNPIASMEEEHVGAGNCMSKIRELSSNFTPPAHACNTYVVTYKMLDEFEKDLHLHVHLENNILFPKAISLEKEHFKTVACIQG